MSTLALEFNDVDALFNNDSLSDNFTGVAMPCNICIAFSEAFWNASDILVGWIPTSKIQHIQIQQYPVILWLKCLKCQTFSTTHLHDAPIGLLIPSFLC